MCVLVFVEASARRRKNELVVLLHEPYPLSDFGRHRNVDHSSIPAGDDGVAEPGAEGGL